MKRIIALFAIAAAVVLAQPAPPNLTVTSGYTLVTQKTCNDATLGSIYTYAQPPASGFSGAYVCQQIGSTSLGTGAYGWIALANQSGTPGSGTVTVATGKAAAISNSLTFAGTDGTTLTGPTTSATLARTDSAQTFTGVQTFSSAPVSSVTTGTAPLTITSTTPVANLTGQVLAYNAAGTQQTSAKTVFGACTLGTSCVITFAGSAAWTSIGSYQCSGTDQTSAAAVKVVNDSASQATFTGTSTDVISYVCIGK